MLYFATTGNYVKIGQSDNPTARVRQIQIHCPEPVKLAGTMPGTQEDERAVHRLFHEHRVRGEWFRLEQPILDYIKDYTCQAA